MNFIYIISLVKLRVIVIFNSQDLSALNGWTKEPHPVLLKDVLFVYVNDGQLVK